jgi:hypothetical protein
MPNDPLTRAEIEIERPELEKCVKEVLGELAPGSISHFLVECFTEKRLEGDELKLTALKLGYKVLEKGPEEYRGDKPQPDAEHKLEDNARAWMRTVRRKLKDFYSSGDGKKAQFEVRFKEGPYRADFYRRESDAKTPPADSRVVDCHYVGDQVAGVEYVIDELKKGEIHWIRDTHIRPEGGLEPYSVGLMTRLKEALSESCKARLGRFEILVGSTVEDKFIEALGEVEKTHQEIWRARQLHESGTSMNFTILHYASDTGRQDEVLFGWGRHDLNDDHVFRSGDERLVMEFTRLFDSLWKPERSHETSLASAGRSAQQIGDAEFLAMERGAPKDSEIWIASPDLANLKQDAGTFADSVKDVIKSNIARGIHYHYIYPADEPGAALLRILRQAFEASRKNLNEHRVTAVEFENLMPIPSHFISIGRKNSPTVYMQLPLLRQHKGWIALDPKTSKKLLQRMKSLVANSEKRRNPKAGTRKPAKRTRRSSGAKVR